MTTSSTNLLRFGLCCQFAEQPIKFRNTTVAACSALGRNPRLQKLSQLCLSNALALEQAIRWCAGHQIGAFRVLSQFWPLKTHPECGYELDELPAADELRRQLQVCHEQGIEKNIRLSFHPDQYVVLNSPRPEVVASSLAELEYQAEAAELIGADVVNIHAGGAYGDKPAALQRLRENLPRLSDRARRLLTLENDDKIYTPEELLPLCRAEQIPLCYDVHHHRCLPDRLSIAKATAATLETWRTALVPREPLFHLSSPLNGWHEKQPHFHHDYIDPADFPAEWLRLSITVDIEAKAKELAIANLQARLAQRSGKVIPRLPGKVSVPASDKFRE